MIRDLDAEEPQPPVSSIMTNSIECLVIGAGVVGLAIGRAIALAGHNVLVVESEGRIGSGTSSRNSEVIHAGIYYAPGSYKAVLCVRGKEMLYDYCASHDIPYLRCGKLIVAASPDEVPGLKKISANAKASGVHDIEMIDGQAATSMEPNLRCHAALISPSTGIIDSHRYMAALDADIATNGGLVSLHSNLIGAASTRTGLLARIQDLGGETVEIACRVLVNAAGLGAQRVAQRIDGMPKSRIPKQYLAKGNYFVMNGQAPFARLIYPLPTSASLGLHYSVDLGGQVRFGPDVEWVEEVDYDVDGTRAAAFEDSIRRYFPGLTKHALWPGYAGIRPKIAGPKEPAADFVIQAPGDHGVPGLINLFGIESPGLTSSLAIAETVLGKLDL